MGKYVFIDLPRIHVWSIKTISKSLKGGENAQTASKETEHVEGEYRTSEMIEKKKDKVKQPIAHDLSTYKQNTYIERGRESVCICGKIYYPFLNDPSRRI